MGEVRQLFAAPNIVPDDEGCAKYLEHVAAQIRAGEVSIARAVLVYTDRVSGQVGYMPFGNPMDGAAMVGILEWAKVKAMLPE